MYKIWEIAYAGKVLSCYIVLCIYYVELVLSDIIKWKRVPHELLSTRRSISLTNVGSTVALKAKGPVN
jgi:hypothetical protein